MRTRHFFLGLAATLATLPALAAGVDGKWNATVDGGQMGPVDLVIELKAEGEKLTGNISAPMMPAATAISEGKIKGEDLSFKLQVAVMEGAPPLVINYTGKLKGDEIAFNSVLDMGQGPTATPFVAKRAK